VCNALHARRFAAICFQCFGLALLNVWGFCLSADGMLKHGFRVACWLGNVRVFQEQINLGHKIIGIDMGIHLGCSCLISTPLKSYRKTHRGTTAVSRRNGIFNVQSRTCGSGRCTPQERLAVTASVFFSAHLILSFVLSFEPTLSPL
jgi:hypothetical protein